MILITTNMKKVFFILGTIFLLTSCGTSKDMIYYVDGECYPTDKNIQKMLDQKSVDGKDYVWFIPECKWMTRQERDSIIDVLIEKSFNEVLESYKDSVSN